MGFYLVCRCARAYGYIICARELRALPVDMVKHWWTTLNQLRCRQAHLFPAQDHCCNIDMLVSSAAAGTPPRTYIDTPIHTSRLHSTVKLHPVPSYINSAPALLSLLIPQGLPAGVAVGAGLSVHTITVVAWVRYG